MEVIIPHTNTDLDALGAAIGAQVLYPHAVILLPGPTSAPASEFISLHRYNLRFRHGKEIDPGAVTRAIVVDTADPARLGTLGQILGQVDVHLYDHHPPEPDDLQGSLEVREIVGATCTLVTELIEESGAPVSPLQATALLLGIYADTGSLTLMGTTERDARAAAFLLGKGANLRAISRFMDTALSPAQQALLHQLQSRARWVTVRGARIRLLEAETPEYVGGLALVVEVLQDILPAHALFAVVKMADRVHLVGRSEVPWVNAARAMAHFGGGGHPAAASAVAKGATVHEAAARLEQALTDVVERPMLARDVMSAPVKAITANKPAGEAERLMLRYGHSGLPVVDEAGRLEGVVSRRDVENARRHGLVHAQVKGIMTRRVLTVTPEMPLDEVQDLMVARDIGRVPVVEDGNLVGIISRSDLLGQLYGGPAPRWHRTLYAGSGTLPAAPGTHGSTEKLLRTAFSHASPAVQSLLRVAGHVAELTGVAVYAVGGFVRDLLLSRPNLDIDLVVEGDGIAYARAFAAELGAGLKEVPRFGTAHVYLEAGTPDLPHRVDVVTARREFYEHAAALPVVEHADLREDLYRRDFSINAMAVRLGSRGPGELFDFFGGLQDLESETIRILHTLSFVEDPTRILRAVRFARRYGFRLEPESWACARTAVDEGFLNRVTIERLRHELVLILQEPHSGGALADLHALGALERLLPGVALTDELLERLDRANLLEGEVPEIAVAAALWVVKLMLLLHGLPLPEGYLLATRLKLKREHAQPLLHALACWRMALDVATAPGATLAEVVRTLSDWTPDGLLLLYLLGGGEMVTRYWQEWRHVRLAITGSDLIAAGVPEGPRIRRALARVLGARLDGAAPDRETQLALALRFAQQEEE
jgi:tRNA nucleotidyltransferase (CCA-adding enzyme)